MGIVTKYAALRGALKSGPTVVVRDGVLQREEMRRQRLGPDEVRQAVRASGVGGMEMIGFVVLETDGTLSVITKDQCGSGNALCDVHLLPRTVVAAPLNLIRHGSARCTWTPDPHSGG